MSMQTSRTGLRPALLLVLALGLLFGWCLAPLAPHHHDSAHNDAGCQVCRLADGLSGGVPTPEIVLSAPPTPRLPAPPPVELAAFARSGPGQLRLRAPPVL